MTWKANDAKDSFNTISTLIVGKDRYQIYDTQKLSGQYPVDQLPFCLKILLENLLRHEDGVNVQATDIKSFLLRANTESSQSIAFSPARVILQDFTGVPAVVDLAAMREAMVRLGGDPDRINPQVPVDLVVDHSVTVDHYASHDAYSLNTKIEFKRNQERYNFLRWGQQAFDNFRVVPPGTGIVHQVNLEYLAQCVMSVDKDGLLWAYPDTLVGTDSHTTMINALGVLGWGVGGIEAEAGMLGQPISMLIPDVVGFKMVGRLPEGATATDLVLTVTQQLRQEGVVGKFVEFYGSGLSQLSLADRATVANMAPEYGATCGIFPIDEETIRYLSVTGRDDKLISLVEAYAKHQGLWRDDNAPANYAKTLTLDLNLIKPSLAGPKRPQDRVDVSALGESFKQFLNQQLDSSQYILPASKEADFAAEGGSIDSESIKDLPSNRKVRVESNGQTFDLAHGSVVIAAITSCTNTSNPSVMIAAGLLAKKARRLGLKVKPWVKTSLAPGSQVVPAYLEKAGLMNDLEAFGFHIVGFGCTTCIGNSGPIPEPIHHAVESAKLVVASVLSGNRNFEGRIHPDVRANYLASPPLVVAYAIAGTVDIDLSHEPLGQTVDGRDVYLKDIWPMPEEINALVSKNIDRSMFQSRYKDVFKGNKYWQALSTPQQTTYSWPDSTYIKKPPYFDGMKQTPQALTRIENARCLVKLGNSITTDHISPAGSIHPDSPAGMYLIAQGVTAENFNSLGSRRGNHEVMIRGTFANIRLRNQLAPSTTGGYTTYFPDQLVTTIYDAAQHYKTTQTPLIVIAGKEYGTGSSRDWAAKGTSLLGVKAVIAESFERIHRSNLVGFGVLPLQFLGNESAESLGITGEEIFTFSEFSDDLQSVEITAIREDGNTPLSFKVQVRIDTPTEWEYFKNSGILHTVIRRLAE